MVNTFESRQGEIKYSNKYRMNMTIKEYRKAKDISVLFGDGYLLDHTTYWRFERDSIRRPSDAPYVYIGDAVGKTAKMRCGLMAEIIDVQGSDPYNLTYVIKFEDGVIKTTTKYSKFTSGNIGHPNINIKGKAALRSDRVGEQRYSEKYSMNMRIIAYRRFSDIDVEFEDGWVVQHRQYDRFLSDSLERGDYNYRGNAIGQRALMKCGQWAEVIAPSSNPERPHGRYFDIQFDDGTVVKDKDLYNFKSGEIRHPNLVSIVERGKSKYVGQKRKNNAGFEMEIIAYRSSNDIDVRFSDGYVVTSRINQWNNGAIQESPELHAKQFIGKKGHSRNGQEMMVIAYRGPNDVDVLFEDGVLVTGKRYSNFVRGEIQNPNCPYRGHFEYFGVYVEYPAYRYGDEVNYHCVLPDGTKDICTLAELKERFGGDER